jgi:hypothetical protein
MAGLWLVLSCCCCCCRADDDLRVILSKLPDGVKFTMVAGEGEARGGGGPTIAVHCGGR